MHSKPVGLLNVDGYFTKVIDFLAHVVSEGFLADWRLKTLLVDENPASLLTRLAVPVVPAGVDGPRYPLER